MSATDAACQPVPASIGGSPFQAEALVRLLPGRRMVVRGLWQQRPVYAKVFVGKGAARYAKRDAAGMRALAQAGILVPQLLYQGAVDAAHPAGQAVVYAAVPASRNLEEIWAGLGEQPAQRLALAARLVELVADLHEAGLVQTDLYLKNFLLQGERIVSLDGDGIRAGRRPVGRGRGLANLALLLSKFDALDAAEWLPQLLASYAGRRGWERPPAAVRFARQVAATRRRAMQDYADRKVFRECSDVQVRQDWHHFMALEKATLTPALELAMQSVDGLLEGAATALLKRGNTCTVGLCTLAGMRLVIKRYNIKHWRHALGRAWRPSRAAWSWANAHRLRLYGIATAAPLALVEQRWGPLRREAYFVSAFVDAPDAAQFFAEHTVDASRKTLVAQRIARLLRRLGELRIVHGDLKANNIKIVDDSPLLIDLDSMREYRLGWLARRGQVRDLRRLLANWAPEAPAGVLLRRALYQEFRDAAPLVAADINQQTNDQA